MVQMDPRNQRINQTKVQKSNFGNPVSIISKEKDPPFWQVTVNAYVNVKSLLFREQNL